MNEQQLADLLSEQIDGILQGHQPVTPAGAADLQPLLTLGQQFSQINVQPTATAQAAFQSQLSAWFGSINGATATAVLGLSKTWLIMLTAAVITIGAALGVVMLTSSSESQLDSQQQIVPNASESPSELPEIPAPDNNQATPVPSLPAPTSNATVSDGDTLSPSSSSTGDTLSPTTSSAGDTLPSEPVLEEPTSEPSPTPEFAKDAGDGPGGDPASDGGGDDSSDDGSNNSSDDGSGDHDKGHGNDADGFDEDNPGNSSGLPGSNQGDNSGGGLDFGQFSSGGNNGGGNGGQGGGNAGGNGGNQGNKGGQGKGKGNK